MNRIEIEHLTKYYGNKLVLDDISLNVKEHEVVTLIGASGSGKSTLLRCVNNLVDFNEGDIRIDGRSLFDQSFGPAALYKKVGIVFQAYNLFPTMTVLDNITLAPRKVHGKTKKDSENKAKELLRLLDLEDFADSYPEQLSGGQQQRVAIVRAMATEPELLLLDEITAALDPELIGGVLSVIKELKTKGMTMLIVTHEMGFARDVSDRVCFLDGGKIIEEAPPQKLFTTPENTRTQNFLQRIIESGRL
ncbi:MAG: amino acid ABC transporter ATP-binding protein [Spirochaetales bacterium]|nr:amino acid ABC transporter ATP-binding protein [Spirochaetales bacterium]